MQVESVRPERRSILLLHFKGQTTIQDVCLVSIYKFGGLGCAQGHLRPSQVSDRGAALSRLVPLSWAFTIPKKEALDRKH